MASTTWCCWAGRSASTRWRGRCTEPKTHLEWTEADDPPCPNVWGDDRRALATSRDVDAMRSMCETSREGTTVRLASTDGTNSVVA